MRSKIKEKLKRFWKWLIKDRSKKKKNRQDLFRNDVSDDDFVIMSGGMGF